LSINIYFDGSSNPPNGNGFTMGGIVFEQDDKVIYEGSAVFGRGTNNYAEFKALWFALTMALRLGYKKANCYGDSTLVIKAMNDHCVVRDSKLLSIYLSIGELARQFDWLSYIYVKRNTGLHALADKLSKI